MRGTTPIGSPSNSSLCQRPERSTASAEVTFNLSERGGLFDKNISPRVNQSVRDIDDLLRDMTVTPDLLVPDGAQLATIPDRRPLPCVPKRDQHREHHADHLYRFGLSHGRSTATRSRRSMRRGRIAVRRHDLQCDLCLAPSGLPSPRFLVADPALLECLSGRPGIAFTATRALSCPPEGLRFDFDLDSGLAANTLSLLRRSGNDAAAVNRRNRSRCAQRRNRARRRHRPA